MRSDGRSSSAERQAWTSGPTRAGQIHGALARKELATVNEQAARLAKQNGGLTRAAIARQLAERIADDMDVLDAVVKMIELIRDEAGIVVPIDGLQT